ncbi:RNA polymerase sigma-70 factor, ECF subfamily [Mucilaginibacter pineti]|uniref:RNA polymerase sigma-70 factor, ECF subfamily n=1 Tax=Mucilaginibacter pineti TaxID=1391627 RepID=A0A1G7CYL2_9SPHI|nr:sigma-70 family RNA polymerase sigma factor [Mucilaginibacter pineti]SDE44361.1 RNA polymerase sigma-70 factor, ECF subfamily [Mucilaginibacter pineti]
MPKSASFTDQDLLLHIRRGDRRAFNDLYDRHWDRVYSQAFKKLKDPDAAKDITQEVFIHLWAHRETNYIDNLDAYLFSSVRNNVFKILKKENNFIPIADLVFEAQSFCSQADAEILYKELEDAYMLLVNSMPPAQQKIYKMRFEDDLPTNEIADQLNISRKTVQNQLTRAVVLLRASLVSILFFILFY